MSVNPALGNGNCYVSENLLSEISDETFVALITNNPLSSHVSSIEIIQP